MNRKLLLTFLVASSGCLYAANNRDEFVEFDLSRFLTLNRNEQVAEIAKESNTPEKLERNLNMLREFLQQDGEVVEDEIRDFSSVGTFASGDAKEVLRSVMNIINDYEEVVEDRGLTKAARSKPAR